MSYAQVKIYLTDTEIEDAILKAAQTHVLGMQSKKEMYVVDWDVTNLNDHAIEANVAFREKEEEVPLWNQDRH